MGVSSPAVAPSRNANYDPPYRRGFGPAVGLLRFRSSQGGPGSGDIPERWGHRSVLLLDFVRHPCGADSFYNPDVVRVLTGVVYPWIVVAVTLVGAVWLYTYRVAATVEYIDRYGNRFHPSEHVRIQPWWSVYATVALIFVGAGVSLWLVPNRRQLIERLAKIIRPAQSPDAL